MINDKNESMFVCIEFNNIGMFFGPVSLVIPCKCCGCFHPAASVLKKTTHVQGLMSMDGWDLSLCKKREKGAIYTK